MKIFEKNWSKSILIFYPASQNRHIHVLACQYSEAFSGHNPLFRKKKSSKQWVSKFKNFAVLSSRFRFFI